MPKNTKENEMKNRLTELETKIVRLVEKKHNGEELQEGELDVMYEHARLSQDIALQAHYKKAHAETIRTINKLSKCFNIDKNIVEEIINVGMDLEKKHINETRDLKP